jgi:large subunit ribosomal protein L22
MSKQKAGPRLPENCALAWGKMIRVSPQKLNLVAKMIRGLSADKALRALSFSPKRIAVDVRKVLASAIANAEHNQGLNPQKLYVQEATVGRALVMRRLDVKARSKAGRIEKPFSHLRVVVCEPEVE